MEQDEDAIRCFKEVLRYAPSNADAMEELVRLYEKNGQDDLMEKYRTKLAIVRQNAEADRRLAEENTAAERRLAKENAEKEDTGALQEKQIKRTTAMVTEGTGRLN